MIKPEINYREFRLGKLNTNEFRHIKLLLFWPVFGAFFLFAERFYAVDAYFPVHCALDGYIPFCEYFLIPYMFWFVYLVGTLAYTFFFDVNAFVKMMKFIILTFSVTMIIYLLFPTCQNLRPDSFERDNIFTRFISAFYQFDTNTNVCPSLHVIGSFAAMFALWNIKSLQGGGWKICCGIMAFLICISTLFMKQHSVLDVFAAMPICLIGYILCFRKNKAEKPYALSDKPTYSAKDKGRKEAING